MKQFVSLLWRRKVSFCAATLVTAAAAVLAIRAEPQTYRAEAMLRASDDSGSVAWLDDSRIAATARQVNLHVHAGIWDRLFASGSEAELAALKRSLYVEQRPAGAVLIRFEASDPQIAAQFTNAIAQAYVEQNAVARKQASEITANALTARAAEVEAQIERDLEALRGNYRSEVLKDRVDANRRIYASLLERISQISPLAGSGIQVAAIAQPPLEPYRTNLGWHLAIAGMLALLAGTGAALLRERTDTLVRIPEDAPAPVIGAIPHTLSEYGPGADSLTIEKVAWEAKDSEPSESYRAILASILNSADAASQRVLLVTSPRANEGKTTIASNLAIALAEVQHRVLLIDADLRRPRLHAIFEVANTSGLGDLLCAIPSVLDMPVDQLVRKTGIPNLSLLPSGPATDGIFNRLYSESMWRLLSRFRMDFDHVIVDAPPVLEVADARPLARNSDGVIVVLRAKRSDKRDARAVMEQLARDGAEVQGIVLNDWPSSGRDDHYRGSYGSRAREHRETHARVPDPARS
jgi:capsular exopolysaccharide synthesis family protein